MLRAFLGNVGTQTAQCVAITAANVGFFKIGSKIIENFPSNKNDTTPVPKQNNSKL